jgi:hypothetical protein
MRYLRQLTKKLQREAEAWTEKLNYSCLHEDEQTFMADSEKPGRSHTKSSRTTKKWIQP